MRSDFLNENSNFTGSHKLKVKELLAASTLTEADSGSIFLLNSATEFATTLPAVANAGAGWYCKFVVKAAPSSGSYTVIEGEGSDANVIIVNGINELEVDTSDDGVSSTGCSTVTFADGVAIKGDFIDVWCDGSNYYVSGQTKADGGISVS
tara:strand:- start:1515 stop:1967 length:453 start_codon:yes stop_codon:yes gene_type:complete